MASAAFIHDAEDYEREAESLSLSSMTRTCKVIEHLDESTNHCFQRKIVGPLLGGRYLDLSRTVRLPASCCSRLYLQTLVSSSVPLSRLPSWKHDADSERGSMGTLHNRGVEASLLRDHTQLATRRRLSPRATNDTMDETTSAVLSVEIKPKAGYMASSPLVLPAHRCKYYRTRYALQQELMQKGHVKKGWQRSRNIIEGEGHQQQQQGRLDIPSKMDRSQMDQFH